jgi:hypothetical protein
MKIRDEELKLLDMRGSSGSQEGGGCGDETRKAHHGLQRRYQCESESSHTKPTFFTKKNNRKIFGDEGIRRFQIELSRFLIANLRQGNDLV